MNRDPLVDPKPGDVVGDLLGAVRVVARDGDVITYRFVMSKRPKQTMDLHDWREWISNSYYGVKVLERGGAA